MNMSQVMAFTQRVEFKTLLEIECKGLTGFSPAIHEAIDEFRNMLDLFSSIYILIVDVPDSPELLSKVISHVNIKRDQIEHIFFISENEILIDKAKVFRKNQLDEMMQEMKALINPPVAKTVSYISIPIDSLVHFKILPFDLYVKISSDKFIKRIPAFEEIDDSTFQKFKDKGIVELHFEKRFNRDFSLMLINNMINKVEQDYHSVDEKLMARNDVFITTQQIVSKLGFKPRVIEVCESVIDQISSDVAVGKDNFSKYLDQLRSQKELAFHFRLMELTSFIATQLIDVSEETGRNDKIRKIIFASMFCDYTLKDPGQLHIRDNDQLIKLSQAEQKLISEHALKASELVNQYQNAPYEASLIIKQHHGSVTGVGLPQEISSKILPLSKCFMTAQEIAYQILMEGYRHPIDVLSDIKLKFIDTPLEDFFLLFEKTCQQNLKDQT
jgi:hypothetical protein